MAYKPGPLKIIGWIIKAILYMIIVFVFSLLIWRIWFSTRIPDKITDFTVTDSLKTAFAEAGNSAEGLGMFNQSQASITRGEKNAGYFSVEDYVIIPGADQVQLIFRYNNSTLEHLAEDFGLDGVPDRTLELFDLTLVKTTDLTPDDKSDNTNRDSLRETRYTASYTVSDTTLLYNYRRVVFEGVTLEEDDIGLFFDIYYAKKIDYSSLPYGALCLYDREMENEPYEISGDILRRLEK